MSHEIWVECPRCHTEFDARLWMGECPKCGKAANCHSDVGADDNLCTVQEKTMCDSQP